MSGEMCPNDAGPEDSLNLSDEAEARRGKYLYEAMRAEYHAAALRKALEGMCRVHEDMDDRYGTDAEPTVNAAHRMVPRLDNLIAHLKGA